MIILFVKVVRSVVMNLVTFSWRVETGSKYSACPSQHSTLSQSPGAQKSKPTYRFGINLPKRQTDMSEQSRYFSSEYLKP